MAIRWLTFALPAPIGGDEAAVAFWCAATGSQPMPPRADGLVRLAPADGDAYLAVQRVGGSPLQRPLDVQLDVQLDDVAHGVADAVAAGASVVHGQQGAVLCSPGGLLFGLRPWAGDHRVPAPGTARADQVCLDVPADAFDAEVTFWERFTSWPVAAARAAEFARLEVPTSLPLHVLLQRRGQWTPGDAVRAHLDVACLDRAGTVAAHLALGASIVGEGPRWTVLRDPAGTDYCLTDRDPATGRLPG